MKKILDGIKFLIMKMKEKTMNVKPYPFCFLKKKKSRE